METNSHNQFNLLVLPEIYSVDSHIGKAITANNNQSDNHLRK